MRARQLLPFLLLGCLLSAQAQVYTWVDENGQKHFGNQPPPTQKVEEVKIQQGYFGEAPPPAKVASESGDSEAKPGEKTAEKDSPEKMCREAMRWTAIDIPNLKEIAAQRKKDGKITSDQYAQSIKGLDSAHAQINTQNCLTSKGEDRKRYECLAGGAGIMVCSGALQDALNKM